MCFDVLGTRCMDCESSVDHPRDSGGPGLCWSCKSRSVNLVAPRYQRQGSGSVIASQRSICVTHSLTCSCEWIARAASITAGPGRIVGRDKRQQTVACLTERDHVSCQVSPAFREHPHIDRLTRSRRDMIPHWELFADRNPPILDPPKHSASSLGHHLSHCMRE